MKQETGSSHWELAINNLKDRLRKPLFWYPYPALISFGLVMVLTGHLLPGLNPRLGSRANILEFSADREKEGAIWIGIYPSDDQLIIVTSDRKQFRWPLNITDKRHLKDFIAYLKSRTQAEAFSTGLLMETNLTKSSLVLAVDQRLKYVHLRPIIYALADAKITRYGFETKILHKETKANGDVNSVH